VPHFPVISIVDDDASVRAAIARFLKSLGYATAAFPSAQEFLMSRQLDETSCIIADVEMPGMNGLEMQEALIKSGNCPPMIFITAYPRERLREQAMKSGAIAFLCKPFDQTRLEDCVTQALHKRQDPDVSADSD
jgi:FixJ family two-component response regulator